MLKQDAAQDQVVTHYQLLSKNELCENSAQLYESQSEVDLAGFEVTPCAKWNEKSKMSGALSS